MPSSIGSQQGTTFMPMQTSCSEQLTRLAITLTPTSRVTDATTYLAPFDVGLAAGEDAGWARVMLILAGRPAILDDQLLLARRRPERLREAGRLDRAPDARSVIEKVGSSGCHCRLAIDHASGASTRALLVPQLRP